jgi:hypothetical protein
MRVTIPSRARSDQSRRLPRAAAGRRGPRHGRLFAWHRHSVGAILGGYHASKHQTAYFSLVLCGLVRVLISQLCRSPRQSQQTPATAPSLNNGRASGVTPGAVAGGHVDVDQSLSKLRSIDRFPGAPSVSSAEFWIRLWGLRA